MQKLFSLLKYKNRGTRPRFLSDCCAACIAYALPRGSRGLWLIVLIDNSKTEGNLGFVFMSRTQKKCAPENGAQKCGDKDMNGAWRLSLPPR